MPQTRDTHRANEEIVKQPNAMIGDDLQSAKITLAGDPEVVTFAGLGLEDMYDTNYRIICEGEGAGKVDESTIATDGFSIIGGSASDVCHLFIHGKVASRNRT